MSARRNFSLLELIVGVLIVGALMAIIFPILQRNREAHHHVNCASNLNQIAMACFMYADSYGGHLPSNGGATAADGYLSMGLLYNCFASDKRIFSCPSNPTTGTFATNCTGAGFNAASTSYCYDNRHLAADTASFCGDIPKGKGLLSKNHGGFEQNICVGSGGIEVIKSCQHVLATDSNGVTTVDDITADDSATLSLSNDCFLQP